MGAELNHINSVIDANVTQNGNNEITGDIMNTVLKAIAAATLQGYHFMGVLKADSQPPANSPWIYVANNVTYGAYQFGADEFGVLYYDDVPMATPTKKILFSASNAVATHNADPTAHQFLIDEIDAIDAKIPAEASSTNKLADKDFVTTGFKPKQTAKADPTASSTTITAIDTITQDADGVITATKKTIQSSSTSQKGVVQLSNSYAGTSETKAVTEKALSDGLATKADDTDVVHKTGAETVSGVKNFSNGLQVSGQLLWYDTTNQCMRITFN